MSTPAVTVYINGDSAQLGEELTKSSQAIRDFGAVSEEAGAATKFSMLEARGSVQLLAGEFGEHVPREISRMIATIPGIGVALESILPIMGAVWAIGKIEKWAEANKKAAQDLTDEQKAAYDAATTGAEKFMKAQEASIKATYELAIAQASGDKIRQDQLRIDEAVALGKAQDSNISKMEQEREVLRGIVAEAENEGRALKATQAERAAHPLGKGGAGGGLPVTEDVDAKAQKARDTINDLTALIEAASLRGLENQAKVIDGIAKEGNDRVEAAKKAARAEEEAFKKYSEIMHRAMEERKRDAIDYENLQVQVNNFIVDAHVAMNKEMDQNNADIRKEEDYWLDSGLKAEQKAADEKVKIAEKAAKDAEKAAKEAAKIQEEELKHLSSELTRTFNETLFHGKNLWRGLEQVGVQAMESIITKTVEAEVAEMLEGKSAQLAHAKAWATGAGSAVSWYSDYRPYSRPDCCCGWLCCCDGLRVWWRGPRFRTHSDSRARRRDGYHPATDGADEEQHGQRPRSDAHPL
jgi:hypothetical protein